MGGTGQNDTITAIPGIRVGHASLPGAPSGCTVILTGGGATAGVDVRGGAPGTYGTDALNPLNLVSQVHGLFLTGGSAFGLSAADGLMRHLAERKIGFDTGHGFVPIIAGAVIFDLGMNGTGTYPDAALAATACESASSDPVEEGCAGAGLGATVGQMRGFEACMKGGVGSSLIRHPSGLMVGALFVVNAFGDIVDPADGRKVAGCRVGHERATMADPFSAMMDLVRLGGFPQGEATVVGVVATNARLNKTQLTKVAQMAHDGLARTIYPSHTQFDGDTVFALSCGEIEQVEVSFAGALAAHAAAEAILRGVRKATSLNGVPCCADLRR